MISDFLYEEEYRELYKEAPLEDIIIFRSGPMPDFYIKGMDFDDNARSLFNYALSIELNKKYKLVWLVKDPSEFDYKYSNYNNVKFVSYEDGNSNDKVKRDEFFRLLCLAKYLFMTDSYGFAMNVREDQVRVMLWHGCGFKTRLGFNSCSDKYEYMTVTGDEYAKTYAKTFGLRDDQMLVTGYPRVDYIFHPLNNWTERLNVPKTEKYIFWMPTFRNTCTAGLERHNHTRPKGESGLPVIETFTQLEQIDKFLSCNSATLIIKLHPFQDRSLICDVSNLKNICFVENSTLLKEDIQINQILGDADALISDYSSVAIDYLVTDRPIGFTLDDVDTYKNERGFFWDNVRDWLPGSELYTYDDMFNFIKEVLLGNDPGKEKRQSISEQMQKYKDDKNSARVFEAFNIRG